MSQIRRPAFYEKNNVRKIVMSQLDMMLQYCDTNLMHVYKTKPVKVVDANENGLNFTPLCDGICF